jgi:hypothetical protein
MTLSFDLSIVRTTSVKSITCGWIQFLKSGSMLRWLTKSGMEGCLEVNVTF